MSARISLSLSLTLIASILTTPIQAGPNLCSLLVRTLWGDQNDPIQDRIIGRSFLGLLAGGAGAIGYAVFSSIGDTRHANALMQTIDDREKDRLRGLPESSDEKDYAWIGEDLYFLKEGYVYVLNPKGELHYTKGSSAVSIQRFNNSIVVRKDSGEVYLTTPESSDWAYLGSNARALLNNDRDLFALTEKGEIWKYRGVPGNHEIVLVPIVSSMPDGRGGVTTTIVLVPMVGGREVSFSPTGIKGVRRLFQERGLLKIEMDDGSITDLK